MRTPLFAAMRAAKVRPGVPAELRHSGILSLAYLQTRGLSPWLYNYHMPTGSAVIREIADRVVKHQPPVRLHDFFVLQRRIAESIYESSTQLLKFERDHKPKGTCTRAGNIQQLYFMGEVSNLNIRTVPLAIAPTKPCRWCFKPVAFKERWKESDGSVRCNSRDCRRMDYLRYTPQSRGGIDLTPAQRKELDRAAWDTQRALNYLALVAKEIKRASRANHVVR